MAAETPPSVAPFMSLKQIRGMESTLARIPWYGTLFEYAVKTHFGSGESRLSLTEAAALFHKSHRLTSDFRKAIWVRNKVAHASNVELGQLEPAISVFECGLRDVLSVLEPSLRGRVRGWIEEVRILCPECGSAAFEGPDNLLYEGQRFICEHCTSKIRVEALCPLRVECEIRTEATATTIECQNCREVIFEGQIDDLDEDMEITCSNCDKVTIVLSIQPLQYELFEPDVEEVWLFKWEEDLFGRCQ